MFILGIIVGLLIAILIVVTMVFFKKPIEQKVEIIEQQIEIKGPRKKGFIFDPVSEEEEARDKIIEKNRKLGKDTPISDLSSK